MTINEASQKAPATSESKISTCFDHYLKSVLHTHRESGTGKSGSQGAPAGVTGDFNLDGLLHPVGDEEADDPLPSHRRLGLDTS